MIEAKLKFQGKEEAYLIVDVMLRFSKSHSFLCSGSNPPCRDIEVVIKATDYTDTFLLNWYIEKNKLSGTINFAENIYGKGSQFNDSIREIEFKDAFCYRMGESLNAADKEMTMSLAFRPDYMKIDGTEVK